MEGCSTRATEKLLSEADPSLSLLTRRDKVRFLGKGKVEIKVVIDEQCHKELEKLKNLLSHRNPKLSYGELISILSKEALKKQIRERKTRDKEKKVQKNPSIKKQEFKVKSIELAAASALRSEQINQCSKEKVTSALRSEQTDQYSKKKHASAPKSEQINQCSKEKVTSAPKLEQTDQYSKEKPASALRSEQINQCSKEKVISAPKLEQTDQYSKEKPASALRSGHQIKKISRFIPSHLRKYIWARDQGQCTYVHHETKHRCTCRHLLQIDHIQPFALGGKTEKENLRLLCAGHNQYRR